MTGGRIVAIGGFPPSADDRARLYGYILELTGKARPKVTFLPTAVGDDAGAVVLFYEQLARRADASHVEFFPWPPPRLREHVLAQDVVLVSGGNTANMLAIWRVYGFDEVLREAWEQGVVLAGSSAGMICWFEAGVTDSFGPQLEGMRDGLGFLAGSACPHYDGEELRRPRYQELVAGGFPSGYAADDGAGLHFEGTELRRVVAVRPNAAAYRVETDNGTVAERRLDVTAI